jgi:CRP/FNR family transcriptional regulator
MCLFSASCVMRNIQFDVMVSAERDSDVLIIPPDVYKRLMEESAAVANYTNDLTASHFSDVMWLMDQILNKKLDSRLSAFLLEESALAGSNTLSFTHEQIAGHLGTIREVVSRMLKYFENEGLVELGRGSVTLLDAAKLEKLAKDSIR